MKLFLLVIVALVGVTMADIDCSGVVDIIVPTGENRFSPAIQSDVPAGCWVTWRWDTGFHNVVQGDISFFELPDGFRSGDPAKEGVFSYRFLTEGDYYYYCEPHRDSDTMVGIIRVVGNAPAATVTVFMPLVALAGVVSMW
eukprot:CAMPEP_0119131926 /NCGR_PEP_ID=MMETSP1310-20130426/10955_1 /TAXON_ID=464262 /ORGANISM="Genus nov. species nov., Strain RCC2339" /LENGTH=140 /DNA_ID=CAMNT_0007122523 /DNA_START=64 /DNA_END=483 /DNA_ORIENTATION=+